MICNFYLSVAACSAVCPFLSLRYNLRVAGKFSYQETGTRTRIGTSKEEDKKKETTTSKKKKQKKKYKKTNQKKKKRRKKW